MAEKTIVSNRFDGKTAVITGGASGIGLATGRRLAAEGAKIVIGDLDEVKGPQVADELGGLLLHGDHRRRVVLRPGGRRGVGDGDQASAGAQRGHRSAQDGGAVQRHVRLEEARGDQVDRCRLRLPGVEVDCLEARTVETSCGGLVTGPADGSGGDVETERSPALLGEPEHVPALPAAEVDRRARRELGDDRGHGRVDLPRPHSLAAGVALLPVLGGGQIGVRLGGRGRVGVRGVMVCGHGLSLADPAEARKRSCRGRQSEPVPRAECGARGRLSPLPAAPPPG